jgi:phage terminase small subunit
MTTTNDTKLIPKALTAKQEAFAQHYAIYEDPSKAYRVAYDAENAAANGVRSNAHKLLKKTAIARRIIELKARIVNVAEGHFDITAAKIIDELAAIAFYDPADYFTWDSDRVTLKASTELTPRQRRAVTAVTQTTGQTKSIKLEMGNKLAAIDKLGKHLGMFKTEVAVKHSGTVNHTATAEDVAKSEDPREALKAFDAFRVTLANNTPVSGSA